MSSFTRKQRLVIAFGGFLFFVGFMVLAIVILAATTDIIDIENLLQFGFLKEILIVIGVLDVVAGILLLRFTSY